MMEVSDREVVRLLTKLGAAETDRYTININKRVANYRYLLSTAEINPGGKRVLDIGCGSGLLVTACALWGARECIGLEVDEEGLAKANEQVRRLTAIGYPLPLSVRRHNVLEGLPFDDSVFDLIVMEEVVSHLAHVDSVLEESLRVLASGGRLIISDNNNPFSPAQQKERLRLWRKFEKGPRPGAERLSPHERSYEAMRAHLISRWHPELGTAETNCLAIHTSGLWGEHLEQACLEYARSRRMPEHVYRDGQCPISPDGIYIERPVDPYGLRASLLEYGCISAQVFPHWASSSSGKRFVDRALRFCLPIPVAMRFARGFIVVGGR